MKLLLTHLFQAKWSRRPKSGQRMNMGSFSVVAMYFALVTFIGACISSAVIRLEHSSASILSPYLESKLYDSSTRNISDSDPWYVFYNVFLNPNDVQHSVDIVKEQIKQIGHSYMTSNQGKQVILSYNTIGRMLDQKLMEDICRENKIHCIHMHHYPSAAEDVTLSKVYEFCHNNPNQRVTYLHNKGSFHRQIGQNELWRRAMMKALTSQECLDPIDTSCNVCTLVFNVVPFLYPAGNFWIADCSYVQKLLPVSVFLEKTDEVHQEFLELRKRKIFTTDLYDQDYEWRFGTDRYANELWVASHPSVKPCDTSANSDIGHWMKFEYKDNDIAWAMAPRKDLQDLVVTGLSPRPVLESFKDPLIRRREYSLLPGMLFRWERFYGEFPGNHSWVWQRFPEGHYWLSRVLEDGDFVTDRFIAEWWSDAALQE